MELLLITEEPRLLNTGNTLCSKSSRLRVTCDPLMAFRAKSLTISVKCFSSTSVMEPFPPTGIMRVRI